MSSQGLEEKSQLEPGTIFLLFQVNLLFALEISSLLRKPDDFSL